MAKYEPKYTPEDAEKLPELFAQGLTIAQTCAELKISRQTYYAWQEQYPEFKAAADYGQTLSEAFHEKRLLDTKLDTASDPRRIFYMKNSFRESYGEQQQKEGSKSLVECLLNLVDVKSK